MKKRNLQNMPERDQQQRGIVEGGIIASTTTDDNQTDEEEALRSSSAASTIPATIPPQHVVFREERKRRNTCNTVKDLIIKKMTMRSANLPTILANTMARKLYKSERSHLQEQVKDHLSKLRPYRALPTQGQS
jgi:hypothetical protein